MPKMSESRSSDTTGRDEAEEEAKGREGEGEVETGVEAKMSRSSRLVSLGRRRCLLDDLAVGTLGISVFFFLVSASLLLLLLCLLLVPRPRRRRPRPRPRPPRSPPFFFLPFLLLLALRSLSSFRSFSSLLLRLRLPLLLGLLGGERACARRLRCVSWSASRWSARGTRRSAAAAPR